MATEDMAAEVKATEDMTTDLAILMTWRSRRLGDPEDLAILMLTAGAVAVVAEGLSDQNARDYGPRLGQDEGKGRYCRHPNG